MRPRRLPRVELPPAVLFARMRTDDRTVVVLLLALAVSALLRSATVPVPFLPGEERVALAPLLPVVPAIFVGSLCGNSLAVQEQLAPARRVLLLRLAWWSAVLAALTGAEELVEGVRDLAAASMVLVSCLSFMGLGMLSAAVVSASASWLVPGCLALTTLTLGTRLDETTRWWAWLLRPPTPASWALTASITLLGLLAYAALDTRVTSRRDS